MYATIWQKSWRPKAVAAALGLGLASMALAGCSSPTRDGDALAYVTYPAVSETGGDGALFVGTVRSDEGCLTVVSDDGFTFIPIYPSNDPRPKDFRVGDVVGVGGGSGDRTTADLDAQEYSVPTECVGLPHTVVHVAQEYL